MPRTKGAKDKKPRKRRSTSSSSSVASKYKGKRKGPSLGVRG